MTAEERRMAAVLVAASAAAVVALGPLSEALQARSAVAAVEAVDWIAWRAALAGWEPLLVAEYLSTITTTVAAGLDWTTTFDATVLARTWGYEHSARLVTAVTETSRDAIRAIVVDGIGKGRSMDVVAGEVRAVVGLHPRWATAVATYRRRLIDDGRPAAQVARMTDRYHARLLRKRSENIARWEVQEARNVGRWRTWKEGQAEGAFPLDQRKSWHADSTACPVCLGLHGETVGLDETFSDGRLMPPDHVRCRCTAVLV
jgi:SPP1 gp7 family putative phage head morphogenesis protein